MFMEETAMRRIILIMDDANRLTAVSSLVAERYPECEIVLFDNAPDTIEWLKNNLSSLALMSLDHDLGINKERNGEVFDPGIGRDVVDYLVTQVPRCPVILHTTNYMARDGMTFAMTLPVLDV
jgi:hypothetical protein